MAKLSKAEKKEFKTMRKEFSNREHAFAYANGVTVFCYREFPGSNVIVFSTSVCSPKDKPSKKRGKFLAIENATWGEAIAGPSFPGSVTAQEYADAMLGHITP